MAKVLKTAAVVVGVAALAVVTGGAALGLGVSLATSVAGISAGTLLLASSGLSLAAGLLSKRPKPTIPSSQTSRLSASIDPGAFRKTVLGQTAMATDVRYEEWSGTNQDYCDWIIALASHAIDGVEEIWLNTDLAWSATTGVTAKFAGYFWVPNIILEGTPENAFTFGSGRWNAASSRLTGCAYLRLRFKVTGNSKKSDSPFSGGPTSRITIIGRGAKLYDPRRDDTVPGGSGPMRWDDQTTWRYTADDGTVIGENLPLQILYRVLGWRIANPVTGNLKLAVGNGVPGRRIGMESFQVAANLADELVNRSAGGQEPRYHGAGVISEGDDNKTILDALCAGCCGRFRDTGGKLDLVIAHNDLASAATDDGLNDDDVIGPFTWDPDPSLDQTPNVVRGKYIDPSTGSLYQPLDYPEVRLDSPDGQDRIFPLDLGFVESSSQAQRVGKQVLERKQYQRRFTAPFDIRAWKYPVGALVPFTFAPLSFTRKLFRVEDQELGQNGACNMTLLVESAQIYAWDADDSAPVQPADAIVYDARNNPLILAIDDAATSANWSNIADDDGNKPDDNATVGAPPGTSVGGRPVEDLLSDLDGAMSDIDGLFATYGDTASAAASASAAEGYATTAQTASDNTTQAKTDAETARDASKGYADTASSEASLATDQASDAASSASAAADSLSAVTAIQTDVTEKASTVTSETNTAITKAGEADASADRAAVSEANALGYSNTASAKEQLAAEHADDAGGSATAAAGSAGVASTKAGDAGNSAAAARASEVSANLTAASLLPSDFTQDGKFWFNGYTGDPATRASLTDAPTSVISFSPSAKGRALVVTTTTQAYVDVSQIGVVKLEPGARYRFSATGGLRTAPVGNPSLELYAIGLDANFNYVSAATTVVSVNLTDTAWHDVMQERDADAAIANGAVYFRLLLRSRANGSANSFAWVLGRLEDVTQSAVSEASAQAAQSSAANASADAATAHQDMLTTAQYKSDTQALKSAADSSATTATNQAAIATAGAAAAQQSVELSANLMGQGYFGNANFANWSGTLPDGMVSWDTDTTTVSKVGAGVYGSPNSLRMAGPTEGGAASSGILFEKSIGPYNQPFGTGQWVVIEVDARWATGTSILGAGVLFRVGDDSTMDAQLDLYRDPDVAGVVGSGNSQNIRQWRKLVQMSGTASNDNTLMRLYVMNNWSGFSANGVNKVIDWKYVNVRAATDQEIAAHQATGDISALSATVSQQAGAIVDLQTGKANASTVTALQATVGDNSAAIDAVSTVAANAQGKANAIVGLKLDVNGKISGTVSENDGETSTFAVLADVFELDNGGGDGIAFSDGNLRLYVGGVLVSRWGKWTP